MHDDIGPSDRICNPLACGQVTAYILNPLHRFVAVSAEHPDLAASVPKEGDNVATECPGAACYYYLLHDISSLICRLNVSQ
ncbi:hypothetical protein KDH_08430 [Dictyobacter sp. S3.2.2.5]|uniref:Uncharacterized protein n=1 Tax=Dictyobacter halimunensis TaxID=3026934 RepID=A0ABQ6FIP6_9CHLR|nr:hypothetical protein KDH_08430 [Dictyobacter sp. S3.2.2.5]